MIPTERELITSVIDWIRQNGFNNLQPLDDINERTDLFAAGLLDSLRFVELITFIESHEGCRVNLVDSDPSEFALIGGLCRLALKDSTAQLQGAE